MQDKEGLNNFWKKLLHKYRFVIITDDSFEEKLSVKLNRLNIFAFAGIFVFICFFSALLLIAYTPLKEYVPGKSTTEVQKSLIELNIKTDSLERALNENALNNENRIQLVDVNMKMKNYVAVDSILTILEIENGFESYCQLQRLFLQLESVPGHCMAAKTDSTIMGQLTGLSNLDPNSIESHVATKLIEFALEINAFDEMPPVVYTRSSNATIEPTTMDAARPSSDFFGLTPGAIW